MVKTWLKLKLDTLLIFKSKTDEMTSIKQMLVIIIY